MSSAVSVKTNTTVHTDFIDPWGWPSLLRDENRENCELFAAPHNLANLDLVLEVPICAPRAMR